MKDELYYLRVDDVYVVAKESDFRGIVIQITEDMLKYNMIHLAEEKAETFRKQMEDDGYEFVLSTALRPRERDYWRTVNVVERREYHYAKKGSWKLITKEEAQVGLIERERR